MGVCHSTDSHIVTRERVYSHESDDVLIGKTISKYEQKILNNAELLLTLGYIRDLHISLNSVPLELMYLCYKYHHIPSTEKKVFMWKQAKPDTKCPDFMTNFIECIYMNPGNMSDPIKTNIILSNGDEYTNKRINYPSSCYVPHTALIRGNEEIRSEIDRKCEQYSIDNASMIITCGQIDDGMPSLTNDTDYCSAIIFDEVQIADKSNHNIYGFEINLPSFMNPICDDMVYSESNKTVLAYQSFYGGSNRIYYLNKHESDWQLLTKINWHKYGEASMIDTYDSNIFVSTNSGESVLVNMSTSKWTRLASLDGLGIGADNIYQHELQDSSEFGLCRKAKKPVFGYNEFYKKMYRINQFTEKYENFYFDLTQNRWIQMNLLNKVNGDKCMEINEQSLWINNQCPNILYTVINTVNQDNIFAYFDERDFSQKQWNLIPKNHQRNKQYHSFNSEDTCVVSMF